MRVGRVAGRCSTRAAFFHQVLLESLGRCGRIALSQPASVAELARLALDLPACGWAPTDGNKDDLAAVRPHPPT